MKKDMTALHIISGLEFRNGPNFTFIGERILLFFMCRIIMTSLLECDQNIKAQ